MKLPKLLAILGPTASGKTALAQYLASVFHGELINADSRQLYKGMDVGTAKAVPNSKIKGLIPQECRSSKSKVTRLIDIVYPNQTFSAAEYKKRTIKIIDDIGSRNMLPILVGGTGLYIDAVTKNLEFPQIKAQQKMREELESKSTQELQDMLQDLDPETAKTIDAKNKRRLVRALEVSLAAKQPFSQLQKKGKPLFNVCQIGISKNKDRLYQDIEKRVRLMITQGLEKEVKELVARYGWTQVLKTTIGYKEWQGHGSTSENEVIENIIKNTKAYAKRQLTWFKKDKTIHWVETKREAKELVNQWLSG